VLDQAYWYLNSSHWGKLSLGRLTTTTGGISTIDLSNTGIVANSQPYAWGAGFIMRNGLGTLAIASVGPGGTITAPTLNWGQMCGGPTTANPSAASQIDLFGGAGNYATDCGLHSLSRHDGVSYLTPTWNGFTFGGTFGEDDFYDVGGRWAGEQFGFRIAAGLGYRWLLDREPDIPLFAVDKVQDTDRREWLASASAMHVPTGLFASGAWVQYSYEGTAINEIFGFNPNRNRPDTTLLWADAGIQKNWTGWGATTFYAEVGHVDDGITGLTSIPGGPFVGSSGLNTLGAAGVVTDSDMTWWGGGMVQTIDAAALDLYLGFRVYSASARLGDTINPANDAPVEAQQIPGGFEDIWFIQAGGRIQF
jgi:hypothetical protein